MPVNEDLFREILKRTEDETLDFKAQMYNFDTGGTDFLKDLLCLANTPRPASAYLVLGVEWAPGRPAVASGMDQQVDDAKLRGLLTSDMVTPVLPTYFYHPLLIGGRHFGVIEVPSQRDVGPFYATKDWGNKCLRDVLYIRRGSVNERANREEQRAAYEWFGRVTSIGGDTSGEQWRRFVDATDSIDVSRQYILISDAISAADGTTVSGLGHLPWFAVIDFDPRSETGGLLQAIGGTLQRSRTLQLAVKGDRPPVHSRNQTIWFFARGLVGRIGTEVEPDPKVWIRSYGKEIDQLTEHLAKAASPAPITVVVLWQEPSTVKPHDDGS